MEFRLLGPIEAIDDDGRRFELGGSRPRALLALLLLHANEVVSSDRLIDELWGAEPPAGVANTLQQTVSRLRRVLGPGRIETRSPGYLLRVEAGELDLEVFEQLVGRGDGGALREALGLWHGEPLADFAYEPFAQGAIARIGELRLAALEQRIKADLEEGRTVGLVAEIEALVTQRPLRERLRGLQMLALYRAGRQADALAAYQDARRLLGEELGLDPSEELQRLEKQILTHDPALDLPAEGVPAGPWEQRAPGGAAPAPGVAESRKVVTVLVCDMAAIGVAEGGDPESLRAAESRGLELAAAAVERHGGTVESTSGGELTAVFGVPLVHEDDALRALRAAVEIREAALGLGLAARSGVHSGEVIAGGGNVAGVPLAVARRLAGAAAADEVLIGPSTLALTARAAAVEPAEPLVLRGGAGQLPAFRVLRLQEGLEPARRMRFVGRAREVALIREAWERARAGRSCELVTIVGDPGVGKSRLSTEALATLDASILSGRCLPYGEGITYWPVVEVLRQLDLAPPAEVAGPIRALLGRSQAATTAGEVAWAFRKTLEQAASEQPLIVVFDDLQWGEDPFLDLLEQTALLSSGASILLLCSARPELLERRAGWPGVHRLEPLPDSDVDTLIPSTVADPLRTKIARASGGNALFLQEMIAVAGGANDDLVVPLTLQAVLAARIDRLDPDERAVLTCAAVEGETFHHGTVQALAPADTPVAARLAGLVRKGLIRPGRANLPGEDGFRFQHILIRDAAYATLPRMRRGDLHAGFANWLERLIGDRVGEYQEILGYHFEQGYRYRVELGPVDDEALALALRAGCHLGAAGRRAADRADAYAAANLLGRATALLPADNLERLELMRPYGYALHQSGRIPEALANAAEQYERATALGERGLAAHAHIFQAGHDVFDPGGDLDEVRAIVEEAIKTFTELGDEEGLASAKRQLGNICGVEGRRAEATVWHEQALVHANACDDLLTRRRVTEYLAMILGGGPMPVGDAIRRCEELRDANRDDRMLEAVITRCLSELLAMAGRFDEARESERRSSRVLDEASMMISWGTLPLAAGAKRLAGDRAGAVRDMEAMWLFFRDTLGGAHPGWTMSTAFHLANLYCDDGRWDDAEECLAFYRDVPDTTYVFRTAFRLTAAARVAAHRGELVEATRLARRGVELTESTDLLNTRARIWLALAEVQRAGGNNAEADAAVAKALALYEQKGNIAAATALRGAAPA